MAQSSIKDKKLIFERANGITYARYANDPSTSRWPVGGNTKGWIPGTQVQCPQEWYEFNDVRPNFALIVKNKKLQDAYKKFLQEQEKYIVWESLHD